MFQWNRFPVRDLRTKLHIHLFLFIYIYKCNPCLSPITIGFIMVAIVQWVHERLLFGAEWPFVLQYHSESKLHFDEMISCLHKWHKPNDSNTFFFRLNTLVTCFPSIWRYKVIHFPVFYQTTTFKISVTCFSSTWRYKTFSRTFFTYFFNFVVVAPMLNLLFIAQSHWTVRG